MEVTAPGYDPLLVQSAAEHGQWPRRLRPDRQHHFRQLQPDAVHRLHHGQYSDHTASSRGNHAGPGFRRRYRHQQYRKLAADAGQHHAFQRRKLPFRSVCRLRSFYDKRPDATASGIDDASRPVSSICSRRRSISTRASPTRIRATASQWNQRWSAPRLRLCREHARPRPRVPFAQPIECVGHGSVSGQRDERQPRHLGGFGETGPGNTWVIWCR